MQEQNFVDRPEHIDSVIAPEMKLTPVLMNQYKKSSEESVVRFTIDDGEEVVAGVLVGGEAVKISGYDDPIAQAEKNPVQ